jgi:antitoxin PrlF
VAISRLKQTESDPMLKLFLDFLSQGIAKNPQHLQSISSNLIDRAQSLVSGVVVDINEPLSDENE